MAGTSIMAGMEMGTGGYVHPHTHPHT